MHRKSSDSFPPGPTGCTRRDVTVFSWADRLVPASLFVTGSAKMCQDAGILITKYSA